MKTRIRRRKEYERKCLELMRDTRESFRLAGVRADDHVGLCAQYFDSLLNVIEGEGQEPIAAATGGRPGRSLLSNTSVLAGTKRSRSTLDASRAADEEGVASATPRGVTQTAALESSALARSSSAGPTPASRALQSLHQRPHHAAQQHRHHATNNMDTSAAETLLNLHSESQPHGATGSAAGDGEDGPPNSAAKAGETSSPAAGSRIFNSSNGGSGASAYYASSHHLAHSRGQHSASTPPSSSSAAIPSASAAAGSFSPGSFISTGMFGHFGPPAAAGGASSSIPNSPQHAGGFHHHPHQHGHHAHHPSHHPGAAYANNLPPHAAAGGGGGGEFGFAPGTGVLAGPHTPGGGGGGTGRRRSARNRNVDTGGLDVVAELFGGSGVLLDVDLVLKFCSFLLCLSL